MTTILRLVMRKSEFSFSSYLLFILLKFGFCFIVMVLEELSKMNEAQTLSHCQDPILNSRPNIWRLPQTLGGGKLLLHLRKQSGPISFLMWRVSQAVIPYNHQFHQKLVWQQWLGWIYKWPAQTPIILKGVRKLFPNHNWWHLLVKTHQKIVKPNMPDRTNFKTIWMHSSILKQENDHGMAGLYLIQLQEANSTIYQLDEWISHLRDGVNMQFVINMNWITRTEGQHTEEKS